ncbi:MAG: methylated-DNA--[protein]-cysteine S-methyltransferase [Chloroflexi bacterium]|nr:methylated-DNA--[protein]-cysteine S-methyltransferase [Chloroflexota bacterium]
MNSYALIPTSWGWLGLLRSPAGLLRLALPQPSPGKALECLAPEGAGESPSAFGGLPERLQAYFQGYPVSFPDELDFQATSFRRAVWMGARMVGYGQVQTYGWLAASIGRAGAARAVGQALGANPFPLIVPCHRIVASDGSLGGWSGEGIDEKARLLEMEGVSLAGRRQKGGGPPL